MTAFSKPGVDVTLLQQQANSRNAKVQSAPGAAAKAGKPVKEAAQDFEAMFLAQMLQPMFKGLETNGMFGGGPGEDVYKEMLVEEYGKAISRAGGVGIAEQVQSEMLKLQEVAGK